MSGSSSSSKSTSTAFPSWSLPLYQRDVLPFVKQQFQQFAQNGGQSPMRQAGENVILGTTQGDYLRPDSNPYLQATANAITRASGESADRILNRIGSNAEQTGSLFSTKTNQQKLDAARSISADTTDRLTQLYGGNYGAERQMQLGAAGTATQLDMNRMLQFLELLKGSEGSSKSSSGGGGLL